MVSPAFTAEPPTHTTPRADDRVGLNQLHSPSQTTSRSIAHTRVVERFVGFSEFSIFICHECLESSLFSVLAAWLEFDSAVRVIRSRLRQVLIPSVIGERWEKNSLRQAQLLENTFGGGRCVYPP